jgi:hypothetical protein
LPAARDSAALDVRCRRSYDPDVASRQRISVELDTELLSRLRAQAAEANVSEGEIVERALRVADLRALIAQIRSRSDLDAEASTQLVREELKAVRAEARSRAA